MAMKIPLALTSATKAADVQFNGRRPWDVQVNNPRLYGEILRRGSLGFGDGYVNGDWDCDDLCELINRLLRAKANRPLSWWTRTAEGWRWVQERLVNQQSEERTRKRTSQHYDINPELYRAMLGKTMAYSCGYWRNAKSLDQAQEAKLELICKKLELKEGERLLDLGCGWGSLAKHAAENYGARVTGITVSREQAAYLKEQTTWQDIRVKVCDYRHLNDLGEEPFDKIASVGMYEHVGRLNDKRFYDVISKALKPEGLALIHTIGSVERTHRTDEWIDRYVFPGGRLPSAVDLCKGLEKKFIIEDWESFGTDYERTLRCWHENLLQSKQNQDLVLDDRGYRFWKFYLLSCAGFFRSRQGQLWQVVLSRPERTDTYRSWRPARTRDEECPALQVEAFKGQLSCSDGKERKIEGKLRASL